MPRDIPIGNGDMLVTIDDKYRIRDLYWPHVGMRNHTSGHVQHFGVWAASDFAWIEDDSWTRNLALDSGVLAEQFDPYSGAPLSVSPLTWSHATVMTTTVQYLLKYAQLTGNRTGAYC